MSSAFFYHPTQRPKSEVIHHLGGFTRSPSTTDKTPRNTYPQLQLYKRIYCSRKAERDGTIAEIIAPTRLLNQSDIYRREGHHLPKGGCGGGDWGPNRARERLVILICLQQQSTEYNN